MNNTTYCILTWPPAEQSSPGSDTWTRENKASFTLTKLKYMNKYIKLFPAHKRCDIISWDKQEKGFINSTPVRRSPHTAERERESSRREGFKTVGLRHAGREQRLPFLFGEQLLFVAALPQQEEAERAEDRGDQQAEKNVPPAAVWRAGD